MSVEETTALWFHSTPPVCVRLSDWHLSIQVGEAHAHVPWQEAYALLDWLWNNLPDDWTKDHAPDNKIYRASNDHAVS
jgi:hypothetical protein